MVEGVSRDSSAYHRQFLLDGPTIPPSAPRPDDSFTMLVIP